MNCRRCTYSGAYFKGIFDFLAPKKINIVMYNRPTCG